MTPEQENQWLFVAETRELTEGERRVVAGPDEDILVVHTDGIILAVAHSQFIEMGVEEIRALGKKSHVLYDLKYLFDSELSDIRL